MSGKNKTLLFVVLVLILFSTSILVILKTQQETELKNFKEKSFQNIKTSYENISKRYKVYYLNILDEYFYDLKIKELLQNKDKQTLYDVSIKKYKILQKENTDLISMKFYTPDNKLFLSMNDYKLDSTQEGGFSIKKAHELKKQISTIEQINNYVISKNIYPIFYAQEYIGAIEININLKYILTDMQKFANISGALFVLKKGTKSFELLSETIQSKPILNQIDKKNNYFIYTFKIKDTNGLNIAKFYFFKDITSEVKLLNDNFEKIAIFLIAMIFISIIIINSGVSRSLKKLQTSLNDFADYTNMIDNNIMMLSTSVDGAIISASNRFCTISGYTENELIGKHLDTLKADVEDKEIYENMMKSLAENKSWHGEFKNLSKTSNLYWLDVIVDAKLKDNEVSSYNFIMHNITAQKQKEDMLYIDELTDTYNRKYFKDVFPRMIHNIKRNGGCVNFIILDIDDFKKYNELYGMAKADAALKKIAEKLKDSLRRPDDYCFRLGGDEFGLLYRSESEDEGYLYAQVLKKNIEMLKIKYEENKKYKVLTVSLGIVSRAKDRIQEEQEIYALTYEHLQKAKADGRNKVIRALV